MRWRQGFMDVMYGTERLLDRPDLLLHTLLELADVAPRDARPAALHQGAVRADLEERLFDAVGPARRDEAAEVLRIGRVSWRLRDDDNLLLSRVESQLTRAVAMALDRLRAAGRLRQEPRRTDDLVSALAKALADPGAVLDLPAATPEDARVEILSQDTPRQLVGQPASPGLASGRVCRITAGEDIGRFRAGNVLVCDAIQPMMTHLVPLAAAVVERRGGMLIHGAIIAREMGIPCVNGIARAVEQLRDGDWSRWMDTWASSRSARRSSTWSWRDRDAGQAAGSGIRRCTARGSRPRAINRSESRVQPEMRAFDTRS